MKTRIYQKLDSKKLEAAAILSGVSVKKIAGSLGISRMEFWRKRAGKRSWRAGDLEEVAKLLGVTEDWLKGDDEADR